MRCPLGLAIGASGCSPSLYRRFQTRVGGFTVEQWIVYDWSGMRGPIFDIGDDGGSVSSTTANVRLKQQLRRIVCIASHVTLECKPTIAQRYTHYVHALDQMAG